MRLALVLKCCFRDGFREWGSEEREMAEVQPGSIPFRRRAWLVFRGPGPDGESGVQGLHPSVAVHRSQKVECPVHALEGYRLRTQRLEDSRRTEQKRGADADPLGPDVLDILRRRRAETSSVFVLPGPGAKGHYTTPTQAWQTLLRRARLEDLRIHDLRRSMGSWMTIQGTSLPIVGKALGQKTSQATSIYARLNLDPVRAAMEQAVEAMNRNRKKTTG